MTKDELMPKYGEGEKLCPECGTPLTAHQTWPGANYRICDAPECVAKSKALKWGRYVGHHEVNCSWDGCNNFVPEGRYGSHPESLTCSAQCWYKIDSRGKHLLKCGCGCGQDVYRRSKRNTKTGLVFVSGKHRGRYHTEQILTRRCSTFRPLVDEFLNGFVAIRQMHVPTIRKGISPFFEYLQQSNIGDLEEVTAKTITNYLVWALASGRRSAAHDITCVSTFFNWMIGQGYRTAGNPVVRKIHYEKKKQRLPRPYSKAEIDFIWRLLRERGNPRLILAAAIALEAGLRISEICRLELHHVDVVGRRLFICLPTKNRRERWAHFSYETDQAFQLWILERDQNCGHNYLLYNSRGNPLEPGTLADEFNRVLCRTYKGKPNHLAGLDRWSIHRLRHTMATRLVNNGADAATVMAAGGWVTAECMAGYAQVDPAVARRGYQEAMRRAQESKEFAPRTKVLTAVEYLKLRQGQDAPKPIPVEDEHCV